MLFKCHSFLCQHISYLNWISSPIRERYNKVATRMATAVHGNLEPFDQDWSSYAEQLKFYFIANDVTNAVKKRAILLCNCGPKTQKLLKTLVPGDLEATPYAQLTAALKDYFDPEPSAIVQRFKFNTRVRRQGESIAQLYENWPRSASMEPP